MKARRRRRDFAWLVDESKQVLVLTGRSIYRGSIEFYHSDDLTYAASIAYYGLLSLFPFFLLLLSIVGNATANENNRHAAVTFILKYFPSQFDFLSHQLDSFRRTRLQLGIGASLGLIWAAMGVFSAISSAVNHAWGVEKQRSYLRHKLYSFLMLVAAGALMLLTLLVVGAIQVTGASWFAMVLDRFPGLVFFTGLLPHYITAVMLIVSVGLIFYFVPNAVVRFRDVWAGAVVTGLLWKGAMLGFSYYVHDMTRFKEINGSIAAVIVFLLWVYVSAIILLYGAEVTAVYARLRRGRPQELPAAPSPRP